MCVHLSCFTIHFPSAASHVELDDPLDGVTPLGVVVRVQQHAVLVVEAEPQALQPTRGVAGETGPS